MIGSVKTQKYIIIITASVSVLALLLGVLLHCAGKDFEAGIFVGLFSSGFLALLISIIDYSHKRKETMEQFYAAANRALHVINQYRIDLDQDKIIDEIFDIHNHDYDDLDTAYGALCFIFHDKKTRKYIYTKIYEPILELREGLVEISYHLLLYKDGVTNNETVISDFIEKATQLIMQIDEFDMEHEDGSATHYRCVQNKIYGPIAKELKGHYYELMYLRKSSR